MRLPTPTNPTVRRLAQPAAIIASALVLLTVLLRIPSFFEPYWYGDEGIYLTIGQSIRHGAILYKDIVDHKTPVIYYLAALGESQLGLRLLLTLAMAGAAAAFFYVARRLTNDLIASTIFSVLFVLLTALPALEGNIANGELFVMAFVLPAAALLLHNDDALELLIKQKPRWPKHLAIGHYLGAGILLGLAILTKVPALFDVLAFFFIGWLALIDTQVSNLRRLQLPAIGHVVKGWLLLGVGVLSMVVASIAFFAVQGALPDYLQYGLLYNFHYVSTWSLPAMPAIVQPFFSFPGKTAVMALCLLILTFGGKLWPRSLRWTIGWIVLALFGAILSNRPYPHYFMQVVPPVVLASAVAIVSIHRSQRIWQKISALVLLIVALTLVAAVWLALGFFRYPTVIYYQRIFNLATRRVTWEEYQNSFNYLLADNYAAARLLNADPDRYIFVWGTDPMLYALSRKQPASKFTVSFHITDLKEESPTINRLTANPPAYIVVMKDETAPLPGLDSLLKERYVPMKDFEHFVIWKRRNLIAN